MSNDLPKSIRYLLQLLVLVVVAAAMAVLALPHHTPFIVGCASLAIVLLAISMGAVWIKERADRE